MITVPTWEKDKEKALERTREGTERHWNTVVLVLAVGRSSITVDVAAMPLFIAAVVFLWFAGVYQGLPVAQWSPANGLPTNLPTKRLGLTAVHTTPPIVTTDDAPPTLPRSAVQDRG